MVPPQRSDGIIPQKWIEEYFKRTSNENNDLAEDDIPLKKADSIRPFRYKKRSMVLHAHPLPIYRTYQSNPTETDHQSRSRNGFCVLLGLHAWCDEGSDLRQRTITRVGALPEHMSRYGSLEHVKVSATSSKIAKLKVSTAWLPKCSIVTYLTTSKVGMNSLSHCATHSTSTSTEKQGVVHLTLVYADHLQTSPFTKTMKVQKRSHNLPWLPLMTDPTSLSVLTQALEPPPTHSPRPRCSTNAI